MQTGLFSFGQVSNPGLWNLHTGTGERRFRATIKFPAPFNTTPQVAVALAGLDASNTAMRFSITTSDIETSEFDVEVLAWGDTLIFSVLGVWIAQ